MAVKTPETNTSPTTVSFDVGDVVPIPRLPDAGIYTNCVEAIPSELVPILLAKVGYTGDVIISCCWTLKALTPSSLEPSP